MAVSEHSAHLYLGNVTTDTVGREKKKKDDFWDFWQLVFNKLIERTVGAVCSLVEGILLHGLRSVSESKPSEKSGKGLAVWVAYKVNLGKLRWNWKLGIMDLTFQIYGPGLCCRLFTFVSSRRCSVEDIVQSFYLALVTVWGYKGSFF